MRTEPVDTFGIALPPEWVRFPLGDDFAEFLRVQRRRLESEAQLGRTAQRRVELVTRQLRDDCLRQRVVLVAALLLPIDDECDGSVGLLAATCTISSITRAELGTELPLTVNTIAAAMARQPAVTDDGTEVANLEPPARIVLPAGPAVKLVRLHTSPPDPQTRQRLQLFVEHVLVPYDGDDKAAVVTLASPNIELATSLGDLFAGIFDTFRTFAGDQPTTLAVS